MCRWRSARSSSSTYAARSRGSSASTSCYANRCCRTRRRSASRRPQRRAAYRTPATSRLSPYPHRTRLRCPGKATPGSRRGPAISRGTSSPLPPDSRRHRMSPRDVRVRREQRDARERAALSRDRRRVSGVAVGVLAMLVVLAGRVSFVAIVQSAHWKAAAAAQSQSRVVLNADRGSITDRNGVDLATDVAQDDVVADPEQVDNIAYYAHSMAPVLGVDETTLRYRLRRERLPNKQWLQYRVIAQNVDANAVEILHEMS